VPRARFNVAETYPLLSAHNANVAASRDTAAEARELPQIAITTIKDSFSDMDQAFFAKKYRSWHASFPRMLQRIEARQWVNIQAPALVPTVLW
jgi:hypothetical protein